MAGPYLSLLPLFESLEDGHLSKTPLSDKHLSKKTPRVGPYLSPPLYLTLCKTDTSVKWTPMVGPDLSLLPLNESL